MSIAPGVHDHKQTNSPSTTLPSGTGVTTQVAGSGFVGVLFWSAAESFSSLADNKGNTWGAGQLLTPEFTTSFGSKCRIYGVTNGVGGAGHILTLTTGTAAVGDIYLFEFTGGDTTAAFDQITAWAEDSATPFLTPTTGTTTVANELLFAAYTTNTPSGTETVNWTANGFTPIDNDGNSAGVTGATGYKIVAATGTYNASITSSVATGVAAVIISIKEAAGGAVANVGLPWQRQGAMGVQVAS